MSSLPSLVPDPAHSRVLIVDDVAKNLQVVGTMLRNEGFEVMPATSGAQALERVRAEPPDLILLDLMMPEMDGLEFLNRIQDQDELVDVPIVVLTAKELTEQERTFLAERTLLILSKGAQPIGSLGSTLSAIAKQRVMHAPEDKQHAAAAG